MNESKPTSGWNESKPYAGPEPELVGKPVTIIYEIVDPLAFRKNNFLNGEIHHGMIARMIGAYGEEESPKP
jgi:hypothetical protein